MKHFLLTLVVAVAASLNINAPTAAQEQDTTKPRNLDAVVIESFESTHAGWSSDEVILNDERNQKFIEACHQKLPNVSAADLNWRLMNLRKAGKLKTKTTKSNRTSVADITHIAEIAARSMHDRHAVSTDQIMADPKLRAEFDQIAQTISPDVDGYPVRKAAFRLRKSRRLRPELIARIANWGRVVTSYSIEEITDNPNLIDEHPGIYIFRDRSGYLYIGQTDNLRKRLKSHLDQSHNVSLANYLGAQNIKDITVEIHSFDPDSRAKETMIRRAYESELIASRKPRFNIQP